MAPRTRRAQNTSSPKKLRQKKLDAFMSSSPARAPQSSPARPTRRGKQRHAESGSENVAGDSAEEGSQSSDPGAIHFEPKAVEISSSDDDDVALRPTPASKRSKRVRRAHSEDSEPAVASEDEEQREIYVRKGKRAANAKKVVVVDSEEDEESEAPAPKRRKLVKGQRPPTPEEEDEDLMDEVDEHRILDSRLRTRDKRTEFQKNLDKLKRKKRGEATQSESSEEDEEEMANDTTPFFGAKPSGNLENDEDEDEEEEEDTFIVEDDTSQAVELPTEFSMNSYQDLLHHFKIVCQLFVHMAVHDADEREETASELLRNQYFSVPLQITRRKLSGMRDLLVAGSTWKPHFRKSLDKYPVYQEWPLDFVVLGCAACNLGGRKSTRQGRLSGEPYDPLTYESIADSETDEDEDEDVKPGKAQRQYDLGRFCAKRTRTYHQFTHWEYHLFHALRDEVDTLKANQEGRGFVQVAYAHGKQPPEDLNDADGIMDWLDERQVIAIQWQEIKTMMENARNLEVKAGKGGDLDSD